MTLHQQRDRSPALRRELQPPRRGHRRTARLADHGAECAVAQPFLHQRQHLGIVGRLGIEDPFGGEPRLVEAGREQVAPSHHPQHRTPGARGDPGEEQGGRGVIAHRRRRRRHLVQRIEPQTGVGQTRIDLADAERQHRAAAMAVAFDGAERVAQGLEDARLGHSRYDSAMGISFLLCSLRPVRVNPLIRPGKWYLQHRSCGKRFSGA